MKRMVFVLLVACGSPPKAPKPVGCDSPEPGQAMTKDQCSCRGGNITLAKGGAVELHCEPNEVELGTVKLGTEDGWCCKTP